MADNESDKRIAEKRRKSDQLRLESWKAIASYLNRSVRTVRRWEATEQLPVHRHRHLKGFSVYAYQAELDEWNTRHQEVPPDPAFETNEHNQSARVMRLGYYAAGLILALVIGGVAGRQIVPAAPAIYDVDSLPHLTDAAFASEVVARELVAPVFSAWADGRILEAFDESQGLAQRLPVLPIETRGHVTDLLVGFWLSLGRIADAQALVATLPEGDLKNALHSHILFAAGDMTRVRDVLQAGSAIEHSSAAKLNVILAMVAIRDGNAAEAKTRLQAATSELVVDDQGYFFVALDMLAGMLKSEGKLAEAVRVLERTMPQRQFAAHNRSGLFWLMCQRQLADLYRESGRESDAVQIEDVLRGWLVLADETFPLAVSLVEA